MTLISGKMQTDGEGGFVDAEGRTVQLKGINLDAASKFPKTPFFPSHRPIEGNEGLFFDGDNVSFVGRPFPLDQAEEHFRRIKSLGYNSVRYVFTWEALEHTGPGIYDDEYISYTVEILRIIQRIGGLYVYLDPHQDVWSRFSGGDGAPMWTIYAAGFDPKKFDQTQAAILENNFPEDPAKYPKMLWPTNYMRLVSGTIFVLFFAGKVFAPKAIINGVNIQDYLQSHFVNAVSYFVKRLKELDSSLFDETVIGIETMNEPNSGFLGTPLITEVPEEQNLRVGTCPTIFQSVQLGMGIPQEVDEYVISIRGPKKTGATLIDPEGTTAWLETDDFDKFYGFKRDAGWELGKCIWAQHGVWEIDSVSVLIDDYFSTHPETGELIDEDVFINTFFVDFYARFRKSIRSIIPDFIIFIQPPPLQIPPSLKGTDLIDDNVVFCPHYYDGMSLMFKTWNRRYNVNTLGIMRHRYSHPMFGIIFGENAIRRSFKEQLADMKQESQKYLGENVPVIFSEIGMPFDMDNKKAYDTDDFSSQTSALDALGFALEGSNLSHSWWCYSAENCHKWGDRFNCEDFAFWSKDDDFGSSNSSYGNYSSSAPLKNLAREKTTATADSGSGSDSDTSGLFASNNGTTLTSEISSVGIFGSPKLNTDHTSQLINSSGLRAADAIIRPYSIAINGEFIDAEFDLKKLSYSLKIKGSSNSSLATRIFVPTYHFARDSISIEQSSGRIQYDENAEIIEWLHDPGEQSILIKNINSKASQNESTLGDLILSYLPCFS